MNKIIKIGLIVLAILIISLFLARGILPTEIDDIHPNIECPELEKYNPDVLWVIPFYEGYGISENKSWCEEILSLNKTLGLHGIYHTYHEFLSDQNSEDLTRAINEFEECFGYGPEMFKAPQLKINSYNKKLVKNQGLRLKGIFNQFTHKVYHCNNQGANPNWMIEMY